MPPKAAPQPTAQPTTQQPPATGKPTAPATKPLQPTTSKDLQNSSQLDDSHYEEPHNPKEMTKEEQVEHEKRLKDVGNPHSGRPF